MKSRDEIVIIILQWMCLYTLGSRGSRELKTFLEIRLISSGIDQKLSLQRERTSIYREVCAKLVARDADFTPCNFSYQITRNEWDRGP